MDLSNVLYFGVFLDDASKSNLIKYAQDKIPEGFNPKFYCHHMTIAFKNSFGDTELIKWCEENIGKEFYLAGLQVGISDKAMAIRVGTKVPSSNSIKHVTIATNMNTGGKPVDSNNIDNWKMCGTIILKGTVRAYYR